MGFFNGENYGIISYSKKIAKQITIWREQRYWTIEQLAENTDLPISYLRRLENGKISPSHKARKRLAGALRVSMDDFEEIYK